MTQTDAQQEKVKAGQAPKVIQGGKSSSMAQCAYTVASEREEQEDGAGEQRVEWRAWRAGVEQGDAG